MSGRPVSDEETLGRLHVEVFVARAKGNRIRVPCWCPIGVDHSYAEWVAAGGPDTSGWSTGVGAV